MTPAQFAKTELGKLERYAPAFPGDPNPIKTFLVHADPAVPGGGPFNAAIVGGWIRVPSSATCSDPRASSCPTATC